MAFISLEQCIQCAAPLGGGRPYCARCVNALKNTPAPESCEVQKAPHYNGHPSGIEAIEIIQHMGFCLGNVFKYVWRADLKDNALEDLHKARYYLEREISLREGKALAPGRGGVKPPANRTPPTIKTVGG
jgi:hypothetical protein